MKRLHQIGFCAALLTLAVGWLYSYQRGAHDFSVFYTAWQHAWSGQGAVIYKDSPDRYLYAPGFAWLLAPLASLPRWLALSLWNLLKTSLLITSLLSLQKVSFSRTHWMVPVAACFLITRPLLIDFQYGQINTIILGSAVLALLAVGASGWRPAGAWFWFSFLAMTKVMCLPLLLVPWVQKSSRPVRLASLLGATAAIVLPIFWVGLDGLQHLMQSWQGALISRGFPLESHNQSFAAIVHHWFSGEPIRIIALYGQIHLGWKSLQLETVMALGMGWSLIVLGFLMILMIKKVTQPVQWIALLCGWVFLPSHLVWKPYFLFGLPAVAYLLMKQTEQPLRREKLGLLGYFALLNFTSVDVLGPTITAYIEAGGILFFAHMVLMGMSVRKTQKAIE